MIRKSFALLVCFLILTGCSRETPPPTAGSGDTTAPAAQTDFEVRLNFPVAVGDRRELQMVGLVTKRSELKDRGKPFAPKSEKMEFIFTGIVKTLAVNEHGMETKAEILVDRLSLGNEKEQAQMILDPRTVVIAQAGAGITDFQRPDGALSKQAVYVLDKLFPLHAQRGEATEKQVFGTTERQKIGAIWPLDRTAAQKYARDLAGALPADAITGGGKLVRAVEVNGVRCLEMQFTLSCKQDTAAEAPKAMKGVSSAFQLSLTETVPVHSPKGPLYRLTRADAQETFRGVPGTLQEDRTLDVQLLQTLETKIKYLGK